MGVNLSQLPSQFHRALALHRQGQLAVAQRLYEEILEIQPAHFDALHLLGVIAAQTGHSKRAVELLDRAIQIDPKVAALYNNRGSAFKELGQFDAALANYEQAIAIKADYAEAYFNRGVVLTELKQFAPALASYTQAIAINAGFAAAYFNRGTVLQQSKQFAAALADYDQAIAIKPGHAEAHLNRANVLRDLDRIDEALASYGQAIAFRTGYAEAYFNRGHVFLGLRQHEAAIASYDQAMAVNPNFKFLPGICRHVRMQICDWDDFEAQVARITTAIERGAAASEAFPILALSGCAAIQRKAAEIFVREECPSSPPLPAMSKYRRHDKIKIGYFSADFRIHPVATLAAELFETHDRSRFETTAFSFGPDTQDAMRQRMEGAFDHFIDVRTQSEQDIAMLARTLEIDIAVDLMGFTLHCRPQIFAMRAAALQVNYLGYPGTMGAEYMDYLVADHTLVPQDSQSYYREKIIYLPDSYQPNDTKRSIADGVFTREDLGLPPTGFVFCCFNNNYKITPGTFASWMQILKRVEGSVLWLLEDNSSAARNLRREATRRGLSAERLIFAKRAPLAEHLARYYLADLFIDTLPYNAHTTASEALWAGLPLLTCIGEAFPGRVAASLLNAIRLPELITSNQEQYVELAVTLATDPRQLANLRQKLADNRLTTPLFDTRRYTEHLESAFTTIYERHHAGLPIESLDVG
jgi:predicted O-linked N-acetylglucosamine transferase (SPINDLY family)